MQYKSADIPLFASPRRADESIRVIDVDNSYTGCSWHFHPEFQLGHVITGTGERLIGDRVCPISEGEVILLGANLPHVWRYDPIDQQDIRAVVVHFDEHIFGRDWLCRPELQDVKLLFARAGQGLSASGRLRAELAQRMLKIREKSGLPRLLGLLEMLHAMSVSDELQPICSVGYQPVAAQLDAERLRRASDYINDHAHEPIDRDTVAKIVHMSGSGFSRFFKTHTGMTFQEFVADVRVSRASSLLVTTDLPITDIAWKCGFQEISTFNRAFKRYRDLTPTQYRAMAHGVIDRN